MKNKRRRKMFSIIYLFYIIVLIIFFLISAEIYYRKFIFSPIPKFRLEISPKPIFVSNSILGWELKPGKYSIYINDSSTLINATINSSGVRKTYYYLSDDDKVDNEIYLYGCSNTFGYSVADSLTQASFLQKMIPNYKVENLGVPAYGLAQMYLSIKQSIHNGRKPNIAVFNYANFHDVRTPLNKYWSSQIWRATTQGEKNKINNLSYPYFVLENDSLIQKNIMFNEITKFWLFAEKSVLIGRMNYYYLINRDLKIKEELKTISIRTATEIMKLCIENEITPIFAFMTNKDDVKPDYEILEVLQAKGYNVLDYDLDYGQLGYNMCPYDCGHPSPLAHKVFAEKLYLYLTSKQLISIPEKIGND